MNKHTSFRKNLLAFSLANSAYLSSAIELGLEISTGGERLPISDAHVCSDLPKNHQFEYQFNR